MQNLKNILIPVAAVVSLSACSSAYQSGQTPDDVYFSAAPAVVAKTEARRAMQGSFTEDDSEYQSYWANAADDNYLRQKVRSGGRWNGIDDFNYWNGYNYMNGMAFNPFMYNYNYNAFNMYSPWGLNTWNTHWGYNRWGYDPWAWGMGMGGFYGSGFNMGFNNFYGRGMYNYWNYPGYYPVVVVKNPSNLASPNRQPLRGYNNSSFYNGSQQRTGTAPKQQEGLFRSVFSNGNGSQQSQSFDRSSRSFNTNTQSSSTMGSSSSGSGGSSRSSGSSGGGSSSSGRGGRGG